MNSTNSESAEATGPAEFEVAETGVAEEIEPSPATVEPAGEVVEPEYEAEREVAEAELDRRSEVAEPAEVVAEPADGGVSAVEASELEPESRGDPQPEAEVPQQAELEVEEAGEVESAAVEPEALEDVEPAVEVAEPEAVADVEDVAEVAVPEESAEGGPDVSVGDPAEEEPAPAPDPVSFTLGGGARSGDTLVGVARGRTCAVRLDGGVSCWGEDALRERLSVAGLDDVVTVSIGDLPIGAFHACVLHKAGTVSCWGPGFEGQLGQGDAVSHYVPVRVPGIRDAAALAAGDSHTCVVHSDGGVSCWGANHFGQLGDGTERSSSLPKRVPGLEGVATIAAGPNATCAVHVDGTLSCWGTGPASVFTEDPLSPGRIEGVGGASSLLRSVGTASVPSVRTARCTAGRTIPARNPLWWRGSMMSRLSLPARAVPVPCTTMAACRAGGSPTRPANLATA